MWDRALTESTRFTGGAFKVKPPAGSTHDRGALYSSDAFVHTLKRLWAQSASADSAAGGGGGGAGGGGVPGGKPTAG